jgi:hypothetical protein
MPYQVDDALRHAMSGTELSRVRTELRPLPPPSLSTKDCSRREGPTLLCNQVPPLEQYRGITDLTPISSGDYQKATQRKDAPVLPAASLREAKRMLAERPSISIHRFASCRPSGANPHVR